MKDAYVHCGRVADGLERPLLGLSACFSLLLLGSLLLLLAQGAGEIRIERPSSIKAAATVAIPVHETRDLASAAAFASLPLPK